MGFLSHPLLSRLVRGVMGFLSQPWVIRLARLGLGALFVFAALAKIGNLQVFATQIQHFEMLPIATTHVLAMTLPWMELVAGLALILNIQARAGAFIVLAMMVVFTVAVAVAAARGLTIDCGCFGSADPKPVGWLKVLENCGLTAASLIASLRTR